MVEGIVQSIVKLSPIFGVLVVIIYYLYTEKKVLKKELDVERDKCHSDIAALNREIRDNEKENITIISKLSDVLDKMSDRINSNHDDVKEQLKDLKSMIFDKINELK